MASAKREYNPLDGNEESDGKPCKICSDFKTYSKMRSMHRFLEKVFFRLFGVHLNNVIIVIVNDLQFTLW